MSDLVRIDGERAVANSRDVAQAFGKRHADVLRSIENLLEDAPELERNFALLFYGRTIGQGAIRQYRSFDMDRKGFSLLVTRFTGAQALRWTISYIDAFDRMEAALAEALSAPALPALPDPIMDDLDRQKVALAFVRVAHLAKRCPVARRAWLHQGLPDIFAGGAVPIAPRGMVDDDVRDWHADRVEGAPGQRVPTALLFEDYQHWCGARGRRAMSLSRFGDHLNRLGVVKKMSNGSWRLDVRLRALGMVSE